MRVKLDENLPTRLAEALNVLGHDVQTVADEGLLGIKDAPLWRHVQAEGRFLVTQDMHFSDRRVYPPGAHAGLMLLRLRDAHSEGIIDRVVAMFSSQPVERWGGCFVVVTESKIRVLKARS